MSLQLADVHTGADRRDVSAQCLSNMRTAGMRASGAQCVDVGVLQHRRRRRLAKGREHGAADA